MRQKNCNICGEYVVSDRQESSDLVIRDIERKNDYCPECKVKLDQEMTEELLYSQEDIKRAINTIGQIADSESDTGIVTVHEKKTLSEQVALLRDLFNIGDETTDEAYERRNSVFISVNFTYDRASAAIPEKIEHVPVINPALGGDIEKLDWKLRTDDGESTGTDGHSRATLVIEVGEDNPYVTGQDVTRLEGAINGINGQWRNNAHAKILHAAPKWYWEADWGMNKSEDLDTVDKQEEK
jgi:hypothetical protein